ncbi:SGNH/GDSL hydrolase family protein [Candidatus Saccharibacteria bacterium]|nr:SGNH/GDSL hydrolase family protein [Candidatus Saccharibacteria bacterium]
MKKIISLIMTFVLVVLVPASSVMAASDKSQIIVFGDSIATGYGLPGYTPQPTPTASASYASILAARTGTSIVNLAIDGLTSDGLLQMLAADQSLGDGDVFILSIGGNDLLQALFSVLTAQFGINHDNAAERIAIIAQEEGLSGMLRLLNAIADIDVTEIGAKYTNNLKQIITTLKVINPNARIIVQTVANPYKGITTLNAAYKSLEDLAEKGVTTINQAIIDGAGTETYVVADVYTAFNSSSAVLTNAANPDTLFDPHPNVAGHSVIADVVGQLVPYQITISDTVNGQVVVDQVTALPGETIELTITPDKGYRLASLQQNGVDIHDKAFTMPAENVEITATFEPANGIVLLILVSVFAVLLLVDAFFFIRQARRKKAAGAV